MRLKIKIRFFCNPIPCSPVIVPSSSNAFSVIGGGDTIAGAKKANVLDKVGYVSTAGGAFLEFLEGKQLPTIACLENK